MLKDDKLFQKAYTYHYYDYVLPTKGRGYIYFFGVDPVGVGMMLFDVQVGELEPKIVSMIRKYHNHKLQTNP